MKNIEIDKITAAWLLIVLVVSSTQGTPPAGPSLQDEIIQEIYISGNYPKVGEMFDVIYRLKLKPGLEPKFGKYCVKFTPGIDEPLEIDKNTFFFSGLSAEQWQEFRTQMQIKEVANHIHINARIYWISKDNLYPQAMGCQTLYLLDPETGQYGTGDEYNKQLRQKAEWWYDHAGEFTSDPVSSDCAARNKEIIAQLQKIEPRLTDWEALYLHYDGIQALMGGMGDVKTTWEERWRFLLDMGWLEKQRLGKGVKEKWLKELIEKYKGKPLIKEQGLNPHFFRGDSDSGGTNYNRPDSTQTSWNYFCFTGQFRYKKHRYNKDQGLLAQTVDMPICSMLVRVRAYWPGQGTIWTVRNNTDANGYFACTLHYTVPTNIRIFAHPIIYFWGATPGNRVIRVSDPTPPFSIYPNYIRIQHRRLLCPHNES